MNTKQCSGCNQSKSLDNFNFKNQAKKMYQSRCKDCQKIYHQTWYKNNKEDVKAKSKQNNRKYRERNRDYINSYKSKIACEFCGESDYRCLDFHHTDSNKKSANISVLSKSSFSISKIMAEVNKCSVLCSNCHRKLHYEDS